jgi:DNA-binding IscR family transcriptional regulator
VTLPLEQQEILAVLTEQPMRGKEIAKRIGHKATSSYLRELLVDLVDKGHVRHVRGAHGGYACRDVSLAICP